jgi:hypothetical protein
MAGGASRTDGVLWGCFLWQRLDFTPKDAGRGGGPLMMFCTVCLAPNTLV